MLKGFNYRMENLQAAILRVKLRKLEEGRRPLCAGSPLDRLEGQIVRPQGAGEEK